MRWELLTQYRCPKCQGRLCAGKDRKAYFCKAATCEFLIRAARLHELAAQFPKQGRVLSEIHESLTTK